MIYNIDLYSRVEAAFGFVAANALVNADTMLAKSTMQVFDDGDKTFAELELMSKGISYKFSLTDPFSSDSVEITAPPPMVRFSREKNISRTIIDNSDYEVVENFGKKSWNIQLEGIIVDVQRHWYPSEWVKKVREIFDIDDSLKVVSQIFQDLGINQIYFDRLDELTFVEGFNDTLKYKLTAYSIKSTEFFLLGNPSQNAR